MRRRGGSEGEGRVGEWEETLADFLIFFISLVPKTHTGRCMGEGV